MCKEQFLSKLRISFFHNSGPSWKLALLHAIPITIFITGLFYYWFALANRYIIFLYNHYKATPFDKHTSSRYWMAGLVADGAVMFLYILLNWYIARILGLYYRNYKPPSWWSVWLICVIPLTGSITYITCMLNQPTLPLSLAFTCAIVTLVGLVFALLPASLAVQQPLRLIWLVATSIGLIPSLLMLRAIELPGQGLDRSGSSYLFAVSGSVGSIIWLACLSGLYIRQRQQPLQTKELFIGGLCLSYLVMPLVHHLFLVPPKFRYVSAAANFFALNPSIQCICFAFAAILSYLTAQFQQALQR